MVRWGMVLKDLSRVLGSGRRIAAARRGVREREGMVGARFEHSPAGAARNYDFAVTTGAGRSGGRYQGERERLTPSRISAAIRLDQKARVLPLRICGLRFNAKNA